MNPPQRRMRLALALLLALPAAALVLVLALAALALEAAPAVHKPAAIDIADVERALQLLRRHDPRYQRAGVVRVVALQQADIQLLLQHAAARVPGLAAAVELQPDVARLQLSLPAPVWLGSRWLNVRVDLASADQLPAVTRWRLGALPLPAWAAWPLMRELAERRLALTDTAAVLEVIRRVDFRLGRMVVFYAWRDDTTARLRAALVPQAEQLRLRAYNDRLVALCAEPGAGPTRSLAELLPPLFALARQRSGDAESATAENRAALLTLVLYASGMRPSRLVPAAKEWPRARQFVVTLAGREDLPLHYLISATLAAEAGRPLADAIGAYKEVADTRGGSGFSFSDLLADRAGTRLGQRALNQPLALQQRLAAIGNEADLLPTLAGLPDGLSGAEFMERFGSVGAPEYQRLVAEIDRRLDELPLLR